MERSFSFPLLVQCHEMAEQIDLVTLVTHSTCELLWQDMWAGASRGSVGKGASKAEAVVLPSVSIYFHILPT